MMIATLQIGPSGPPTDARQRREEPLYRLSIDDSRSVRELAEHAIDIALPRAVEEFEPALFQQAACAFARRI